MKRLIAILLACAALAVPMQAKECGVTFSTVSSSGSTVKGARGVTFIFSSDFTGTIGGVAFSGATDSSYSPPVQAGDTLAAVAYVVTTGSIRIITVR